MIRLLAALVWLAPGVALAQAVPDTVTLDVPGSGGGQWSLSLQVLIGMTVLTLLPALVLSMTSFVRIVIVLSILRQALGTAQTPPNQVLIGIALFLSLFIMGPVLTEVNAKAVQPYLAGDVQAGEAYASGIAPLREFMLNQTRAGDLELFVQLSGQADYDTLDDVPLTVVIPSFIVSELKTAFQIGFLVFVPFLIIDLVVSSVLMSMGMMMLSPMLISLPFKIMLFVLVDGWSMLLGTLASSFFI
ncbi:MAG: flagellar type III secretion system pore protein FliP [Pseudomonadota bacterium]